MGDVRLGIADERRDERPVLRVVEVRRPARSAPCRRRGTRRSAGPGAAGPPRFGRRSRRPRRGRSRANGAARRRRRPRARGARPTSRPPGTDGARPRAARSSIETSGSRPQRTSPAVSAGSMRRYSVSRGARRRSGAPRSGDPMLRPKRSAAGPSEATRATRSPAACFGADPENAPAASVSVVVSAVKASEAGRTAEESTLERPGQVRTARRRRRATGQPSGQARWCAQTSRTG